MNIYEYLEQGEIIDKASYIAAQELIGVGHHVIPLDKGEKRPTSNIKKINDIIKHPINLQNVQYYFDRDCDIGIMLQRGMEVIDIDEKNSKGITKKILNTIEQGWPELYQKLVICTTPTGGAHIEYFAEKVGGDPVLARVEASPHPLTVIERIDETNKQYIKTAPSAGYFYIQGNPCELPKLDMEERGWLMAVMKSYDQTPVYEVKKKDIVREDSPWKVFNTQKNWRYILDELTERNWKIVMELNDRVVVKRPDATSRHSGSIFKDSNVLYLFSTGSELDAGKGYTPFGIYAHFYHDGNIHNASKQLASEGIGINITDEGQFWKKEHKRIKIKYTELAAWLESIGYYFYDNQLVQVIHNKVRIAEIPDLIKAFLNEVEPDILDDMIEKVPVIFKESGGLMQGLLTNLTREFVRDTKNETWFFFTNCAVKVTNESCEPILYNEINGLVWEENIIKRRYEPTEYKGCDAERFINILGGNDVEQLNQIIGYNLSRYKDPLISKSTVIMEDVSAESEGESQGRSGKGVLVKFIKEFRKTSYINGKTMNFSDTFLWQSVQMDTNLIFIDDVEKSFRFTKLFSQITEGIEINAKNKAKIIIPYETSPKIIITSNYAVGEMDESTYDRKFEFPVVKRFTSNYKPIDEFGRAFFIDWDVAEWCRFDNFMISCAQRYLMLADRGKITVRTSNSIDRNLINDTDKAFVEWMDDQLQNNFFKFAPDMLKNDRVMIGGKLVTNAINVKQYKEAAHNPDYYIVESKQKVLEFIHKECNNNKITQTMLTKWIKKWAQVRDVEVDLSYKKSNDSGRFYRFISWPDQKNDIPESNQNFTEDYF
jgi:putative sterol carrier protein